MPLQIGIVGLPNVGKSTLFQAITKVSVDCANFPFCTIDPNVGVVEVPDPRLKVLADLNQSEKIIPTTVEFVDIAGLVKGAAEGQGLGNKFLSHIRECDAILQVVRAFENSDVIHVDGSIAPERDAETIQTELAIADLETVSKRLENARKQTKAGHSKELDLEVAMLEKAEAQLGEGKPLRELSWTEDELKLIKSFQLLTMKPMMYAVNVDEEQLQSGSWKDQIGSLANDRYTVIPVCVKMEAELAGLSSEEQKEYLDSVGQEESGLDRIIKAGYEVLGLITFLTSGEKETRAWTVRKGALAPEAAGRIHTDFEKNFIRVEVCTYEDYAAFGGEAGCKEKGKLRVEGKDYEMKDGDVCYFRIGG